MDLWLQRPDERRTESDVVAFYREMEEKHPNLLRRWYGDAFRGLTLDLARHILKPGKQ